MKADIKLVVMTALGADTSIPKDSVNYAMDILEGKIPVPTTDIQPMSRVIHRAEARKLIRSLRPQP